MIGYRTNRLPRFHTAGDDDLAVPARLDDVEAVARWCRTQWSVLGTQAGVLLANPIPPDAALEASEVEGAVAAAEDLAATRGDHRPPTHAPCRGAQGGWPERR